MSRQRRERGARAAKGDRPAAGSGSKPESPKGGLADLLGRAPATHRRQVATAIGLAKGASGAEIAAHLLDPAALAPLVTGLPTEVRELAAVAVFRERGQVPFRWYGPPSDAARELERHGLALAFGRSPSVRHRVAPDLQRPLATALAARYATAVKGGRAARYVAAPLQTAHDAAALSAFMARTPVRVKADGDVYSRFWAKLIAALPEAGLCDEEDTFGEIRLTLALWFLRDGGFLRLQASDRPGSEVRRELVPAGDLAEALSDDPGALRAGMLAEADHDVFSSCALALAAALDGRTVSLAGFGAALHGLLEETGLGVHDSWSDPLLALRGLEAAWLAGALELGLDGAGEPTTVRLAAPALDPPAAGGGAVCQGNFELVMLRPPAPHERLVLELACERSAGQGHVFQITRASVRVAAAAGVEPGEALKRLAGELPQNVERSIADWTRGVERPLRLRSAIVVDARDAPTAGALADGPLAGLVVERLGETLLAVHADSLREVERALAAAGRELEPGLDRVSGAWVEPASRSGAAESAWMPASRPASPVPDGAPISTLDTPAPAPVAARASHAAGERTGPGPAPGGLDPLPAIADALEREADVDILYAGARGLTSRRITPLELDGARLHAWCHLRGDERSFWLHSIRDAQPATESRRSAV